MVQLTLPSGLKINTFVAPPAGFDITKASDSERVTYGLPRLPVALSALQTRWEDKMKRYRLVEPIFKPRVSKRRNLPPMKLDHSGEQYTNWSGGVVARPTSDRLQWVAGTWTMPVAALPAGAQENVRYCASAWVGIDGDQGSSDVLQAGCDADVTLAGGATQLQYFPWSEWYPLDSSWITNLPVSPGHILDCMIGATGSSGTTATIFLGNKTTGIGLHFSAQAPQGTVFSGNCAEWIVEAFGSLGPLANYGQIKFSDCNSGTGGGATIEVGSGITIDMVDADQQIISRSSISGATDVTVTYVATAVA